MNLHKSFFNVLGVVLAGTTLFSCGGRDSFDYEDIDMADTLTFHSQLLTIADCGGGVVRVDIADPWQDSARLASYVLVNRDSVLPDNLPSGMPVLRVPLERAAVFSSVHTAALKELGVIDCLAATADVNYLPKSDTVSVMVSSGKVLDAGESTAPSVEVLAASGAEALLRSTVQGGSQCKLPSGIIPIECIDYMENSPIGRAEWILLFGELFDCRQEAREILDGVIDEYSSLMYKVSGAKTKRPTVLTETETSGVWYVPAGQSYMARMLADAGADYPWSDTSGTGSLALNLESVADKAMDADMWLIRSYGYETTPATLAALNPRYASFKAFKDGEIYSCNSAERLIFNDVAFHPEKVLADYVAIFHPDVMPEYQLRYFRKAE